jgi:hypothetical protein
LRTRQVGIHLSLNFTDDGQAAVNNGNDSVLSSAELNLHAGQRGIPFLGFDRPTGFAVPAEQVVGKAPACAEHHLAQR